MRSHGVFHSVKEETEIQKGEFLPQILHALCVSGEFQYELRQMTLELSCFISSFLNTEVQEF